MWRNQALTTVKTECCSFLGTRHPLERLGQAWLREAWDRGEEEELQKQLAGPKVELSQLGIAVVTGSEPPKLSLSDCGDVSSGEDTCHKSGPHYFRRCLDSISLISLCVPSAGPWGWGTTIGFYNFDLILIFYVCHFFFSA